MLNWLLGPGTSKAVQSAWAPEMVNRVSRHVEDQVFAITGRRGALLPSHSSMTDLLIGAYIVGALEGYARTIPEIQNTAERGTPLNSSRMQPPRCARECSVRSGCDGSAINFHNGMGRRHITPSSGGSFPECAVVVPVTADAWLPMIPSALPRPEACLPFCSR
ncbi:hypothetical protein ACFQY9_04310 [Microvirga aerilata]|uniref:hypothetical protein n=1 Tax=Microvirga aerilata TaxID=670292 RepID=UPI0036459889